MAAMVTKMPTEITNWNIIYLNVIVNLSSDCCGGLKLNEAKKEISKVAAKVK